MDFAVRALWFELLVTNTSRIESDRNHSLGPSWKPHSQGPLLVLNPRGERGRVRIDPENDTEVCTVILKPVGSFH